MSSDTWDAVAAHIKKGIFNERSILSQFPPEAASITAREIILSLPADCSCKKGVVVPAAPVEPTPVSQKRLGRHGNTFNMESKTAASVPVVKPTVEMGAVAEARSKRFSVKLETDADVQWVMQAINYGLTMPPEHWDIVTHSVHLYCEWLGCLLPAQQGQRSSYELPHALLTKPAVYGCRLLAALCRFFAPRASSTTSDNVDDIIFSFLNQSSRDPPDPVCVAASAKVDNGSNIEEIVRSLNPAGSVAGQSSVAGAVAGEAERWMQENYIPLVSLILSRVEQILYTSHLLIGPLWDSLLEFCLAICYAVLAPPPQVECSAITISRPFSQSPGVRGMLQLECLVIGMLNRVWRRAMNYHNLAPAYWQGLQELCRVSRHRVGLSYIWSRVMLVFTYSLLYRPQIAKEVCCPPEALKNYSSLKEITLNPLPLSAFQPVMGCQFALEVPQKVADVSWFWLLNLLGNPVDLCHPAVITHTPVFEDWRRTNGAARCRLTAAFLPAIFHHVMRSLSIVVDIFLGITPSLSGCLSTFVGVPQGLYGPLIDVPEYFQYASVRSPDAIFLDKQRGYGDQIGTSADFVQPDGVAGTAPNSASLANLVRNAGLSSFLINPQTVAEAWIQPDFLVTFFYNRPHLTSLLRLLGPWLFEAAVGRSRYSSSSAEKNGAFISERSLKVDNVSFHVGRAEAMACLCRIFIYARKTKIPLDTLTRFYVCLIRALTVDPEVEYVLSTVLFHTPDLLRANLAASFSLLAPALFNAAQWVLRRPSVVCPEYISMVLLRRASLHQLLSMVCLSNQFDGIQFQEITSTSTSDSTIPTARALRMKLASLLCDLLGHEVDTHNLRMLLGSAYTLVLDMISSELHTVNSKFKSSPSNADPPSGVETASSYYGLLLEKICTTLRRWMNDFAVAAFALDILGGLANAPVPQPSMARCRRCIQSICGFIEAQCRREKKDHTKSLHSLIINAFHCLGVWMVAHPNALNDYATLRAVIETTKLGIFGAESAPLPQSSAQVRGSSEILSLPSCMPFSKRVNEAAEHLLVTLFSVTGSFPQASGPETFSSRLTEEWITQLSTIPISNFQHFLAFSSPTPTSPATPDLLLSIAETIGPSAPSIVGLKDVRRGPTLPRVISDPTPVFTFLRDSSGRHLWSWKLRYEPKCSEGSDTSQESTIRSRDTKHLKSCLENSWPIRQAEGALDPFMPWTRNTIPLVRAEKEMPTLAQSVLGSTAHREVETIKSVIAEEAKRTAALRRRICEARTKSFSSSLSEAVGLCQPEQPADRLSSGHLLSCHLGYVPVNNLQASSASFRVTSDVATIPTNSNNASSQPEPASIQVCQGLDGNRRIPGTRGVGGSIEAFSLMPSALTPLEAALAQELDSQLVACQRSIATLFVFYVKEGQTALQHVIANMDTWSETSKDFQVFVRSLGWPVNAAQHPGWRGPLRSYRNGASTATAHFSVFDVHQKNPAFVDDRRCNAPDGVEDFLYWADASTEVVTLCPSRHTEIEPSKDRFSPKDLRAAVLWLESWDDALWTPAWMDESDTASSGINSIGTASTTSRLQNPLQVALSTQFGCSLIVLVHPLASSGLFRLGLLRPRDLGHAAGPLITGLLLSAPLLGTMIHSTLVSALHRLSADSGDSATSSARRRLAAVATKVGEKRRMASAVELLLWSSERCY